MKLIYATSNIDKFHKARINLAPFDIEVIQQDCQMVELQTYAGEEITRHKAKQAYEAFNEPVLVSDDTWEIPALNGFPGTNMKQCNYFLTTEDWLRLMDEVDDRQIFLISYLGYHDGSQIHCVSMEYDLHFLDKPRGMHKKAPILEIVSPDGVNSIAELITDGRDFKGENEQFWKELAGKVLD